MPILRGIVSKNFLIEFEQEYIRLKSSFEEGDAQQFDNFRMIEILLLEQLINIDLDSNEIKNIITSDKNPLLKKIFKSAISIKLDVALFTGFKERDGQDYFSNSNQNWPFQFFCLGNNIESKKLKRYTDYYGFHFINVNELRNISFQGHFQTGIQSFKKEEVLSKFSPFSNLLIIDPYILSDNANRITLLELLKNEFPTRLKNDFYIDIITTIGKKDSQTQFDERCRTFIEGLNELTMRNNQNNCIVKIHQISSEKFHDRNYIGNGFLITMGYGLEGLKNKKESDIFYKSILNDDTVNIINQKLLIYKNIIKQVGKNPIWKIVD